MCMTLSTDGLPVIYFCLKLTLGINYMIGCTQQDLTLIHIVHAREVLMKTSFLHNGCTFNIIGHVGKGVLPIITLGTLKWLK